MNEHLQKWLDAGLHFYGIYGYAYPFTFRDVKFMDAVKATNKQFFQELTNESLWRKMDKSKAPYAPYAMIHPVNFVNKKTFVCDKRSCLVDNGRDCPLQSLDSWTPPDHSKFVALHEWASDFLQYAPWFANDRTNGIILAGGFVTMVLMGVVTLEKGKLPVMPAGTDINVFMCLSNVAICDQTIHDFVVSLTRDKPHMTAMITMPTSRDASILVTEKDESGNEVASVKFQLSLAAAETPSHVLASFNVSACKLAYDGGRVYASDSALETLATGVMLFDATKSSKTSVNIYSKYMTRYNLLLYLPGVSERMVKTSYDRFTFMGHVERGALTGIAQMLCAIFENWGEIDQSSRYSTGTSSLESFVFRSTDGAFDKVNDHPFADMWYLDS